MAILWASYLSQIRVENGVTCYTGSTYPDKNFFDAHCSYGQDGLLAYDTKASDRAVQGSVAYTLKPDRFDLVSNNAGGQITALLKRPGKFLVSGTDYQQQGFGAPGAQNTGLNGSIDWTCGAMA